MSATLKVSASIDTGAALAELREIGPRLLAKDATLWGSDAQAEASIRLGWIDLPHSSRDLLPELDGVSAWARSNGLTNVVLCGMGGSSLSPEVIAKSFSKTLTVLDSTDPDQILAGIPADLLHTVVVVGSKSGSTVETASQKALFTTLFTDAGLAPQEHLVIVTDPGSPLDQSARADGLRVINANPNVGGRYSALSAFGLVPAALMGVDPSILIDDAAALLATLSEPDSIAHLLAAAIFAAGEQCVGFSDAGSQVPGLSDWIEQLVAESTGKNQTGRLPVVLESASAPLGGNGLIVSLSSAEVADINVEATLGEHFILWEFVTALLGYLLKVDPFSQPNVTEAKDRTNALLATWQSGGALPASHPAFSTKNLEIYSSYEADSLAGQLSTFFNSKTHYFATMAYLHRGADDAITTIRSAIAGQTLKASTFGWGPRFLHSTGQFHKGGQLNGAFLQITGENASDCAIPGRDFTFHTLLMAQALGDGEALASRSLPLMRIHLKNRSEGISELLAAISAL